MEPDGVIEVGSFGVLPQSWAIQYYQCYSQTGFYVTTAITKETGILGEKASIWVAHHWFTQMATILLQLTCQFIVCLLPLFQTNCSTVVENFDDMNLKENLLRGIYAYGFEKPSAIQQRAIVPCIEGK